MLKTLLKVNLLGLLNSIFFGKSKENKKKSGPASKIMFALLFLFLMLVVMFGVGAMFSSLASTFCATELEWLYFAMVAIFIFLLTFVGSVFSTQNLIFNAKDTELLLSMPVPPSYILISRTLLLFILNLMYGLLMAIPAIAVYCIHDISSVSIPMICIFTVAVLLMVVFSCAVTCFFGWLIALISSKFKKSNLIQTILSLAFFFVYFIVCFNIQSYIQQLAASGDAIASVIKKAMPLFYFFGIACGEQNIIALLALAAICIIPFVVACVILSKSFIKISTTKKSQSHTKYVEKELKVSSPRMALLRKEFGRFFSLPIYILNCSTGCIMQVLFAGALVLKGPDMIETITSQGIDFDFARILPVVICIVMGLCSSMVDSSACALSLEGSRINLLRSTPISSDDLFFSKFMVNFIIGLPTLVIGTVVCFIGLKLSAVTCVISLITLVCFFALTVFINLTANVCLPKFSWASEAIAVKQSISIVVGMFAGFFISIAAFAPFFFLTNLSANVYLLCAAAVCAVACLAFLKFLKTSGKKRFERMSA